MKFGYIYESEEMEEEKSEYNVKSRVQCLESFV